MTLSRLLAAALSEHESAVSEAGNELRQGYHVEMFAVEQRMH